MHLVVTQKLNSRNSAKALDLNALALAFLTPGSGVTMKAFTNVDAMDAHIETETGRGSICHVFGYALSHQQTTSTQSVAAVVPSAQSQASAGLRVVK